MILKIVMRFINHYECQKDILKPKKYTRNEFHNAYLCLQGQFFYSEQTSWKLTARSLSLSITRASH